MLSFAVTMGLELNHGWFEASSAKHGPPPQTSMLGSNVLVSLAGKKWFITKFEDRLIWQGPLTQSVPA